MTTPSDLIDDAIKRYKFRRRFSGEPEPVYLRKLIQFVAHRDYAAAHELRVGKRQADWTSEEAHDFRQRLSGPRDPKAHDPRVPFACVMLDDPGPYPVHDANLLRFARDAMDFCVRFRNEAPTKDFRIMASVLLTTGKVLHGMPERSDRIRLIKYLAQTQPVYGWWVAGDVWVHGLNVNTVTGKETADKTDAFIVHVGSRTLRRVFTRRYRVEASGVIWRDLEDVEPDGMTDDPYAELLVSVPEPEGKPS
jgi:hypothetical protein